MIKAIFTSAILIVLAFGMNSCKKCYTCTLSYQQLVNGNDSTIVIKSELCNRGQYSAGHNLNIAVKDEEANGYTCVQH